jgi:hypothetical protein
VRLFKVPTVESAVARRLRPDVSRRNRSPEHCEAIRQAQLARWARIRNGKPSKCALREAAVRALFDELPADKLPAVTTVHEIINLSGGDVTSVADRAIAIMFLHRIAIKPVADLPGWVVRDQEHFMSLDHAERRALLIKLAPKHPKSSVELPPPP